MNPDRSTQVCFCSQPIDYLELASQIVDKAKKRGARESEVFISIGKSNEVKSSKMQIEAVQHSRSHGVALRVLVGSKMGLASTTRIDRNAIDHLVDRALRLARESSDDRNWEFPTPPALLPPMDLYDESFESMSITEKKNLVLTMEGAGFAKDPRIKGSRYVSYVDEISETFIVNSRGLRVSYKETSAMLSGCLIAEEGNQKQQGWAIGISRRLSDLHPEKVGLLMARRALLPLGGKPVKTGRYPVVMESDTACMFLAGLSSALNGYEVFHKRSFLSEHMGERVGSNLVTIIDDGTQEDRIGTSPIDDEGTLTSRKRLIEKGILKQFYYDIYTANQAGTKSTGNGKRSSYASLPRVAPTNLYLEPTSMKPDELLKHVKEGFYVSGIIGRGIDAVTGVFSIGAAGAWIRNGELAEPVASVTIASNMMDMMKNIQAVACDLSFAHGCIGSPTILIGEMTVAGH